MATEIELKRAVKTIMEHCYRQCICENCAMYVQNKGKGCVMRLLNEGHGMDVEEWIGEDYVVENTTV